MRTICGLDVHKDSVFVCILNENGILFQEKFGVLTPDPERVVEVLHEYEATEVWRVQVFTGCPFGIPSSWEQCRALVGKNFALITVRRYESCTRYLAELIKLKYDKEDLPITEVNGELVRAFEFYLKTEKNCQQNTVIRYMKCLKKIINLALANEWITKNPFAGIKFHEKEVVREFLTMDELMTIYQKEFTRPRLALVRDVCIFAAFTGLAFIDVQQLDSQDTPKDE